MALHDKIGENDSIDSEESPLEIVSYEPREVEAERSEERSDAQRIKDKDPEIEVESSEDEIEVSPHAVWKPEKDGEEEESEEVEEETSEEESEEEQEEESEEEEKKETKPAQKKKKSIDPVQKRINKITREKYDAKREAERLAKELAEAKKKLKESEFEKKKSSLTLEKPNQDDFETDAEYYEALGRWGAKVELHEAQLTPQEEEVEDKYETLQDFRDRVVAEGKEVYPDFEELVLDDNLPITPVMVEAAMDSKYAPDIFYLLAQSPDRAAEISRMKSPSQVAREIGRIESEFLDNDVEEVVAHDPSKDDESIERSKPKKKKKKEAAPPPVKPLGGGGKVKKNLEDMSLADYYEARGFDRTGFKKSRIPK